MTARHWLTALSLVALSACGGGGPSASESPSSAGNTSSAAGSPGTATISSTYAGELSSTVAPDTDLVADSAKTTAALTQGGVLLPAATPDTVSGPAIINASNDAAAMPGTRGIYADIHARITPLLPESEWATVKASAMRPLQIAPGDIVVVNQQIEDQQNLINPPPPGCPGVECATECVQASAEAKAGAFAVAAAKTCAWARAWACVYNGFPPFNRVCVWAKSTACASAFAAAFAFDVQQDTDRKCLTVCSNGTKIVQDVTQPSPAERQ